MHERSCAMHVAGWCLDITVLDHRARLLRASQPPAEAGVDHVRVAQSAEGLVSAWAVVCGARAWQLREVGTRVGKFGDEILHPCQRSLDSLNTVVSLHVLKGVERALEADEIEVIAKRRHRRLQSSVLARKVLEM